MIFHDLSALNFLGCFSNDGHPLRAKHSFPPGFILFAVMGAILSCVPCVSFSVAGASFLQLRGEPKSGTGFMYEWAVNALMFTCAELNRLYGQHACSITWRGVQSRGKKRSITRNTHITHMKEVLLVFEPANKGSQNVSPAPCKCEKVDR